MGRSSSTFRPRGNSLSLRERPRSGVSEPTSRAPPGHKGRPVKGRLKAGPVEPALRRGRAVLGRSGCRSRVRVFRCFWGLISSRSGQYRRCRRPQPCRPGLDVCAGSQVAGRASDRRAGRRSGLSGCTTRPWCTGVRPRGASRRRADLVPLRPWRPRPLTPSTSVRRAASEPAGGEILEAVDRPGRAQRGGAGRSGQNKGSDERPGIPQERPSARRIGHRPPRRARETEWNECRREAGSRGQPRARRRTDCGRQEALAGRPFGRDWVTVPSRKRPEGATGPLRIIRSHSTVMGQLYGTTEGKVSPLFGFKSVIGRSEGCGESTEVEDYKGVIEGGDRRDGRNDKETCTVGMALE